MFKILTRTKVLSCLLSLALLASANANADPYTFSYTFQSDFFGLIPYNAGSRLFGQIDGTIDPMDPNRVIVNSFGTVNLSRPGFPLFVFPPIANNEFNTNPAGGTPAMTLDGLGVNFRVCPNGFTEPDLSGALPGFQDCPFAFEGGFLVSPGFVTAADGSGETVCMPPPNQVRGCRVADNPYDPEGWSLIPNDDGDGIEDAIDGTFTDSFNDQSTVASNDFTDQHLGGTTHGTIVDRSDNVVTVTDNSGNGVKLRASGGTGVSLVLMCGPSNIDIFLAFLTDGDDMDVECGSFTGEVLSGPVTVTAGVNVSVIIPTGGTAFMDVLPGNILSISNLSEMGGPDIVIEDNGVVTILGPVEIPFMTILEVLPDAPEDLVGRAKPGKVNLRWTLVEADTYDVYRSGQSGGPYDLVGSVNGNVFVDTNVTTGETYFYVVQAVAAIGSSENSNEVEVLVPTRRSRR